LNIVYKKRSIILLILLFISILSIFPYFFNNYIFSQDDLLFHRTRLESYTEAIRHLDFFPRVFPTMGLNFGYAADLFYPSILLLPFALFRIVGLAFVPSYYLYQFLISFVTAATSYYFLYSIKKSKKQALLFACFYTLSSYRLIDQSVRAALGETLAFAFLPLFALGVYSIVYTTKHRWQLLAVATSLLIASHLITAFYSFIFLMFFILINWKKSKLAQVKSLIQSGLLTLCLSAWFLFPYLEQVTQLTFNFSNTTLWSSGLNFSLANLIVNSLANVSAPFTELKPNIGLLLIVFVIIAGIHFRQLTTLNKRLAVVTFLLIVLATNLFPWGLFKLSIIAKIQFPWRMLLFASFFASLLAVGMIEQFRLLSTKMVIVFILITSLLTLGFNVNNLVQSTEQHNITVTNNNVSGFYESEIGHGKEYLVKDTDFKKYFAAPGLIIDGIPYTSTPNQIKNNYDHSNYTVRINGNQEVQLPKFYYKGYEVKVDQEVAKAYNKNGLLTVTLDPGVHSIEIFYKKTNIQKLSVIFSFITAGTLVLYNRLKKRR